MMKTKTRQFLLLALLGLVLMSLPWLVPHMGWTVLVGLVPLLCMDRLASEGEMRHFWWCHYAFFVIWNAVTTWWVWNATPGGAVFAILANALQMSLVWGSFRFVKRRLGGVLPYIFLAAAWIAWEKYYLSIAEISWPWLVLGNAFGQSTSLVQWYSVTGSLGGSLWVWACNLAVFGLMVALSDGRFSSWNLKARSAAVAAAVLVFVGPVIWSFCLKAPVAEESLDVVIAQPNLDPYQKFNSLTQEQQDRILLSEFDQATWDSTAYVLAVAPETFTGRFMLDHYESNPTFLRFQDWLREHPNATLLFGASTYTLSARPSRLAYEYGDAYIFSHNSAMVTDTSGRCEFYHKSKLVPAVELTPYPAVIQPIENLFGGNLMGRCVGQEQPSLLTMHAGERDIRIGCAVCYESVYGDWCAGYVRKGAEMLAVITNDAWWGNTPGYKQHLSYSRLRAIETRRYIARCANTGISAIIDSEGHILDRSGWWVRAHMNGRVGLIQQESFFVRYGDICGRASVFLFVLLLLAALVRRRK